MHVHVYAMCAVLVCLPRALGTWQGGACQRGSKLWGTLALQARRCSENMCCFGGTHGGISAACLQEVIWGLCRAPADMCEGNL